MQPETLAVLQGILKSDASISTEEMTAILSACRQPSKKRKLITARQAMEILAISRPTLRAYVKAGKIEQINISSRKVRFDEASVLRLANMGGAQ